MPIKSTSTYQLNIGSQFLLKEFKYSEENQKDYDETLEEIKYWQRNEPWI